MEFLFNIGQKLAIILPFSLLNPLFLLVSWPAFKMVIGQGFVRGSSSVYLSEVPMAATFPRKSALVPFQINKSHPASDKKTKESLRASLGKHLLSVEPFEMDVSDSSICGGFWI
jgi:hypothetical protein